MRETVLSTQLLQLSQLLDEISNGDLALVDFQRDFDWSEADVRALVATVLMGWPAGSLLFLHGDVSSIATRSITGAPPAKPRAPFVVLDGQQRLTALYQALRDDASTVYAIRLASLLDGSLDAVEEGIRPFPRDRWTARPSGPSGDIYIPLSSARDPEAFFSFRDDLLSGALPFERERLTLELSTVFRDRLSVLNEYEFPVVFIESEVDEASVSRIFERVNRTGQRLGAFDLVVARVYQRGMNLRNLWDDARLAHGVLDRFLGDKGLGQDALPLLQAIALRERGDVRQSAVLDLPPQLIGDQWQRAVDAARDAVEFLAQECGVLQSDWLPYRASLVTLIALAMDHGLTDFRGLLRRWFFTSGFGLRFQVAANTRTVEDFGLLTSALASGDLHFVPPARSEALTQSTRSRYSAIWRSFVCLLANRDAVDLSGRPLGLRDIGDRLEPSEDIVVATVLGGAQDLADIPSDVHLRTLGMVLASRETARLLKREGFGLWHDPGLLQTEPLPAAAAETQLLPRETGDPASFLRMRLSLVAELLRREFNQPVEEGPLEPV